MAQPIKKQTVNPWNFFSKELTTLIDFIIKEIAPMFGATEITPALFVYSALENTDCMLYKALNTRISSVVISQIHDEIGRMLTPTAGMIGGKIDFSAPMQSILSAAYELLTVTDSEYITSDHILLAILLKPTQSLLGNVFKRYDIDYKTMVHLSREVHDVLSNDVANITEEEDDVPPMNTQINTGFGTIHIMGGAPGDLVNILNNLPAQIQNMQKKTTSNKQSKTIDFCTNLNELCEVGEIEELIGREKELSIIYNVLGRKKCNNALLVGEPGVGKTQCVMGLVKNICDKTAPIQFHNKTIWKLNPAELVAGTQLRGQFEERVVTLVNQLKANKNTILFIDDIDNMFGNKSSNSDYDIGGVFSELITNGTTQIIATTTTKKCKSISDNNPDILDKFQQVVIEKPSLDECVDILTHNKSYYEKFHHVVYSDDIIFQLVNLCNRYITNKQLPASAFDILDELGSYKKLNSMDNHTAKTILQQIHQLEEVKNNHIKKDRLDDAADVDTKIEEFRNKLARLQKNINRTAAQKITNDDLYLVISQHTNIPITKVSTTEKEELKHISETLKNVVVGQDEAIDIISRAIKRNKIGLNTSIKPRLAVLTVGPTGVGKTLIAKTLAKEIYGDEKYLVRFDMSEYADETSVNKLIGASAGYVGYTEGGLLTEAVKNKKYCVLLIDEIEKAHDKVYNLFLQIMDEGFLTDNTGNKVDFRNTIIIMTSNVGAKKAANTKNIGFSSDDSQTKEDVLKKELKNKFPPEFLNRLDDIIFFNPLTDDNLKDIIRLELGYLQKRVQNIGYDLKCTDDVVNTLFETISEEKEYGARPIHRAIRDKIENKLTDMLIDNDYPLGKTFEVTINEEKGLEIV